MTEKIGAATVREVLGEQFTNYTKRFGHYVNSLTQLYVLFHQRKALIRAKECSDKHFEEELARFERDIYVQQRNLKKLIEADPRFARPNYEWLIQHGVEVESIEGTAPM